MGTAHESRLIVLRHAKSAWPDVPDLERPLAGRGRRSAPLIGAWLREAGYVPELVLCSPARRTRQTWELAAPQVGGAPRVVVEPSLYGADADEVITLAQDLPDSVRTALVLGHLPTVQDVVLTLAGKSARGALDRVREKFPTGAAAVLTVPSWAELGPGAATLAAFTIPRDLAGAAES
jgi:phosphohistidine phosphatase